MPIRRPFPPKNPPPGGRFVGFPGAQQVPPLLEKANRLFAAGQYQQAAALYESIANRALQRNGPRAPFLFIHTGRAYLLCGQIDAAMNAIQQGLSILVQRQRWNLLQKIGTRVINELNNQGHPEQAKSLTKWLEASLAGHMTEANIAPSAQPNRPQPLPVHCPSCGGPVHPDEVEWADPITAICSFCGNILRDDRV